MTSSLPYPTEVQSVPLPSGPLELFRPPRPEALLDHMVEGPPDPDDKMPYWADLWPAAVGLAEAVDDGSMELSEGLWVELGSGLGLVSLAAARRGAQVLATDWVDDALIYIAASAERNQLKLEVAHLDWRRPPAELRPAGVLAADVLYEARNGPWLLELLKRWAQRPGFEAVISDPGRELAKAFFAELSGWRVMGHRRRIVGPHVPTGRFDVDLYRLTPASTEW